MKHPQYLANIELLSPVALVEQEKAQFSQPNLVSIGHST